MSGCEVGPHGKAASEKYDFQVVEPPLKLQFDAKFDCIFLVSGTCCRRRNYLNPVEIY